MSQKGKVISGKPDKLAKTPDKNLESQDDVEPSEELDNETTNRWKWLNQHLKGGRAIPVRPSRDDLEENKFLLTSVSEDLTKCTFLYQGKTYATPEVPLRKIYELEGIDTADVDAWNNVMVLVRKKLRDEKPTWVPLSAAIPEKYRKRKRSTSQSKKTTKATKRTSKATKKATKDTPSPPKKIKKSEPKKKKQKTESSDDELESPVKSDDDQVSEDKSRFNIGYRKLSADKVLNYEERFQNVNISAASAYTLAALALNRTVVRNVFSFTIDETIALVPAVNEILARRNADRQISGIDLIQIEDHSVDATPPKDNVVEHIAISNDELKKIMPMDEDARKLSDAKPSDDIDASDLVVQSDVQESSDLDQIDYVVPSPTDKTDISDDEFVTATLDV